MKKEYINNEMLIRRLNFGFGFHWNLEVRWNLDFSGNFGPGLGRIFFNMGIEHGEYGSEEIHFDKNELRIKFESLYTTFYPIESYIIMRII
jgi:hypothetical protein